MQMEIDEQPDLLSLKLKGSFDELSSDWLLVMGTRLDQMPVDVLMNMSEISYIDSRGLGALFDLNKRVEDLGFCIFFCELSTAVTEVFELAGLQHILRVYETEASARRALQLARQARSGG
ncbi:MAG: STAS domain-containing protein [Planctomycetota bacterium]|jgi:anti-anti-sigma factor